MLWEAQSRGLQALLVEEHDYCSQTSANSLKTIHGGIRYLQTLNLARTWRSSKEPEVLLNIAPHLIHQLACLLPTEKKLKRSRLAVFAGFSAYNLIKRFSCRRQNLPTARCLTKSQLNTHTNLLDFKSVTGAGLWFDAQVQHAQRLGQAFVSTAQEAGADAYNYLKASAFTKTDGNDLTLVVNDQIDHRSYEVTTRSVIFCTASQTLKNLSKSAKTGDKRVIDRGCYPQFCRAMNIVINKKYSNFAIGLQSGFASQGLTDTRRLLFSAPWRNSTLFGTWYFPSDHDMADEQTPTDDEVNYCLEDINKSYPQLNLCVDDILQIHCGLLPMQNSDMDPENNLMEKDIIGQPDKTVNVFTVIPAKYTTCRLTAEKTIDLLGEKIETPLSRSISAQTPLKGADLGTDFSSFVLKSHQQFGALLPKSVIEQLCVNYGGQIKKIIQLCERNEGLRELIPGSSDHIKAQLHYELKLGNVFKLQDFICGRSFLGASRNVNNQTTQYCLDEIKHFYSKKNHLI